MANRRISGIILGLSVAFGAAAVPALAVEAVAPATPAPTDEQTHARNLQAIIKDYQAAAQELGEAMNAVGDVTDGVKRAKGAPRVIAALKKQRALALEMKHCNDPRGPMLYEQVIGSSDPMLAEFGDKPTLDRLSQEAQSSDSKVAAGAKGALLYKSWLEAGKDPEARESIIKEATELARDNPGDMLLTQRIANLADDGADSAKAHEKFRQIAASMKNPMGKEVAVEIEMDRKLHAMQGKPLTIESVRDNGATFSTAQWKGKVILVDFWATWCAPCRAELPRVKKAYADFHSKGLEVLGVSCDNKADALKTFLEKNPDMPWPQLFDTSKPGWSSVALGYGVRAIPTMFLIDKHGVLRTVTARENFEKLIPQLLSEE